jgi:hypothetical protein
LLAAFFSEDTCQPDKRTRNGLFLVFGLSFLATLMSLYVSYTPVGSPEIQGVHGRYFIVIFPLILLGLVGLPIKTIKLDRKLLIRMLVGITLVCLLLFSTGMYLAFYVNCGTAFYQPGLCYRPAYKNWSPNSNYFQPLSSTQILSQWIIPKCNGMNALRVWIDSTGSDPNGITEFILNDEEDDVVKLDITKSNSDLPIKDWLTLTFPINMNSGGIWYSLNIKNVEPALGQGIRVASSIRAEYIDAPLYQNQVEIENDIIFQYGCSAGWQNLFNTFVTLLNKRE